jgi:hypothetical protein
MILGIINESVEVRMAYFGVASIVSVLVAFAGLHSLSILRKRSYILSPELQRSWPFSYKQGNYNLYLHKYCRITIYTSSARVCLVYRHFNRLFC